jgi:hypothetical protein
MAVYVDDPVWPFGRMMMCHMFADTTEELLAMADAIGVARKWIQKPGTWREHFDICKSKRELAIRRGARAVDSGELIELRWNKHLAQRAARSQPESNCTQDESGKE